MKLTVLFASLLPLCSLTLPAETVSSPNGMLQVDTGLDGGHITYTVSYQNETVLEPSPLGLKTSIADYTKDMTLLGMEQKKIEDVYRLPHGKVSEVHYQANELTAHYSTGDGSLLDVVFRVSDRDVAFTYHILGKEGEQRIEIQSEATGFDFPIDSTATVTPQVAWGGGFAHSKPSYEEAYQVEIPVTQKSYTGLGYTFPGLFHVQNKFWVLLSETGVSSAYAGTRMSDPDEEGTYHIAFPGKEENNGMGDATVFGALPLMTPWRTLTVGSTLAPIVETTVATDVVTPQYEASQDYKTGKASWSWILWQDASMNWDDQITFIDLAAEMGYEFILVDAWWDANIGRDRMKELVRYAEEKDVSIILWYNSNGYWNDAFQTPRNCMDNAVARKKEMTWLQSIGVKGLKVDFFGGDKQVTMKLYEDILTDANTYGLNINFHGTTLPRGWERMYPNHMTSEAITASENLVFSQDFADAEACNSTLFPFVRNPVAAMDYGPVLLNKRFSRNPESQGNIRRTTDTFQLATAVLYQSPIQHFGITPLTLEEQPDYVIDFLKEVPAVWDEVRYVDGYPGKYVVLARRKGDHWYIAATHSSDKAETYSLSLPWLKGEKLTLLFDKADRTTGKKEVNVDASGKLNVTLEAKGGAVAVSR